jgi:predicted nucleic acid-binding protein
VKVLIDTNIIVDVAFDRDPFFTNSEQVLRFVEQQEIQGYLCASTFSDLYYIIRKARVTLGHCNFSKEWRLFAKLPQ